MRACNLRSARAGGFTLVEVLVALALITGLTLMTFSALAPWLNLRQKVETERRLEQVKEALEFAYRTNAMTAESRSDAVLQVSVAGTTYVIQSNAPGSNGICLLNETAAAALAMYFSDDPKRSLTDGASNPLCIYISRQLSQNREGVTLFYRVIAIVAPGNDGVVNAGTTFDVNTGRLTIGATSDDLGVIVNGFATQYDLFQETRRRIERVAEVYGSYFTARYLSNPARDYVVDYFVAGPFPYDAAATGGPIGTGGQWLPVSSALANLGLGPEEKTSAYESSNAIEVANQALSSALLVNGVQVQEPNSKAVALPPYTALLRARLPGPAGNYLLRVVPGNY